MEEAESLALNVSNPCLNNPVTVVSRREKAMDGEDEEDGEEVESEALPSSNSAGKNPAMDGGQKKSF